MTTPQNQTPVTLLTDTWYNRLRQAATVILPALGTLYFTLAQIWGFPNAEQIVGTIAALNLFTGAAVGVAKKVYDASGARYSGTMLIEEGEDTSTLRLASVDPVALDTRNEITFKILRQ